jgi:hypothetical protein
LKKAASLRNFRSKKTSIKIYLDALYYQKYSIEAPSLYNCPNLPLLVGILGLRGRAHIDGLIGAVKSGGAPLRGGYLPRHHVHLSRDWAQHGILMRGIPAFSLGVVDEGRGVHRAEPAVTAVALE